MNFKLICLIFLFLSLSLCQIEGPKQEDANANTQEEEHYIPPPLVQEDEYFIKFQNLITEFDQNMQNMNPDDIITFSLKANSEEVIMEEIHNATEAHPSVIRGLFFIVTPEENEIEFKVLDPEMNVINQVENRLQGAFSINISLNGTYYFVFNNRKSFDAVQITFIFHHFNEMKEIATGVDVSKFELDIRDALTKLKEVEVNEVTAELRQEIFLANIQLRKKRIYLFTVLETVVIVITTIFQIYFIKRLLDNKVFV